MVTTQPYATPPTTLTDYLPRFKSCFPKGSRFERYLSNEIIVRNVKDLPGYIFRIAGPRQENGYISQLPEEIVSITIPPQDGKAKKNSDVYQIYPKDHIEMAIVEAKNGNNKDLRKAKEIVGIDTLVAWLDGHVFWRKAVSSIADVDNFGHVFVEKVNWGNNGCNKPIAYLTEYRYPGKKAIVINTRSGLDDSPETIAELVRALHIDNRISS